MGAEEEAPSSLLALAVVDGLVVKKPRAPRVKLPCCPVRGPGQEVRCWADSPGGQANASGAHRCTCACHFRAGTRWAVAHMPDGTEEKKETARGFTRALVANVAATPKQKEGWIVVQWAKGESRLKKSLREMEEQWHGKRKVAIVPVTIRAIALPEKEKSEPRGVDPDAITKAQRACLESLQESPKSLWDFGSTTIHRLRALGFITTESGKSSRAEITNAGRMRLGRTP